MRNSSRPCQPYSAHFCISTSLPVTSFNRHHQQVLLRPFCSEKSTIILICEGVIQGQKDSQFKVTQQTTAEKIKMQAVEFEFLLCKAEVLLPLHSPASLSVRLTLEVGQQSCSEHRLENIEMIVGIEKFDAFITRKIL